jgi:hypothetical protein
MAFIDDIILTDRSRSGLKECTLELWGNNSKYEGFLEFG